MQKFVAVCSAAFAFLSVGCVRYAYIENPARLHGHVPGSSLESGPLEAWIPNQNDISNPVKREVGLALEPGMRLRVVSSDQTLWFRNSRPPQAAEWSWIVPPSDSALAREDAFAVQYLLASAMPKPSSDGKASVVNPAKIYREMHADSSLDGITKLRDAIVTSLVYHRFASLPTPPSVPVLFRRQEFVGAWCGAPKQLAPPLMPINPDSKTKDDEKAGEAETPAPMAYLSFGVKDDAFYSVVGNDWFFRGDLHTKFGLDKKKLGLANTWADEDPASKQREYGFALRSGISLEYPVYLDGRGAPVYVSMCATLDQAIGALGSPAMARRLVAFQRDCRYVDVAGSGSKRVKRACSVGNGKSSGRLTVFVDSADAPPRWVATGIRISHAQLADIMVAPGDILLTKDAPASSWVQQ